MGTNTFSMASCDLCHNDCKTVYDGEASLGFVPNMYISFNVMYNLP